MLIHLLLFVPDYPLSSLGSSSPRRTRNTSRSTVISDTSTGSTPSKVGDVVTSPWMTSGQFRMSVDCSPKTFWSHGQTSMVGSLYSEEQLAITCFTDFRPVFFVTNFHTENSSQKSLLLRSFFWQNSFGCHLRLKNGRIHGGSSPPYNLRK